MVSQEAALRLAAEVDPVAAQIGAVNTLIRKPDGSFKGYNTDCSAAIGAIERRLSGGRTSSPSSSTLSGKTFLVLGAGGAGRALAFGAANRGAKVIVTNRGRDRAEALVASMTASGLSASVADWEAVQRGEVRADVLANSTSLGMAPKVDQTPVPRSFVGNFGLVFDAVYTPVWTRLLLDAKEAGCEVVDGLQMFVGQAADQFRLFTGTEPPVELIQRTLTDAINKGAAAAVAATAPKK